MDKKFDGIGDDKYVSEGLAIFIKGKMVIGIHPDNLTNNIRDLENGNMKINWGYLLENNTKK